MSTQTTQDADFKYSPRTRLAILALASMGSWAAIGLAIHAAI